MNCHCAVLDVLCETQHCREARAAWMRAIRMEAEIRPRFYRKVVQTDAARREIFLGEGSGYRARIPPDRECACAAIAPDLRSLDGLETQRRSIE